MEPVFLITVDEPDEKLYLAHGWRLDEMIHLDARKLTRDMVTYLIGGGWLCLIDISVGGSADLLALQLWGNTERIWP